MFRLSLIFLIAGSVLFLIAAFWPVSRVFGSVSSYKKLLIIEGERTAWTMTQILFGAGALITAIAICMLAYHLRTSSKVGMLFGAAGLLVTGAVLWTMHVYLRAVDPRAFVEGLVPLWHFVIYTFLTQIALAMFGYYILQSPFADWAGWMFIIGAGALFVLTIVFKDMPPLVYYVLFIVGAFGLLYGAQQ